MKQNIETTNNDLFSFKTITGVILIFIGVVALLVHRQDVNAILVLLASAGLLALGSILKQTVLIVIGCLLGGIGLGNLVYAGPWTIPAGYQKGLFMLCLAIGWLLIPAFTRFFSAKRLWMIFVPGVIAVVLAGAVLVMNNSWIMYAFIIIRSLSAPLTAFELILIGSVLLVPWKGMKKNQYFRHIMNHQVEDHGLA